ncbi:Intermediate filament protein [Linnemannia exigua]|uniref:Intermediate filament protein n=1 Tax=Linnemannia exigua TaxID=604196 RepID=A0AAD4DLQ9_9FUNG|nr:Intermediate filament protein [Linnemannia exigua]
MAAAGISAGVLILSWAFGNSTLRTITLFILATPFVLVFSLLTLALSNIAFSILYTRRQRINATIANPATVTQTPKQQQHQRQKNNQRNMPGQTSRHMFHYLRPARFTRPLAWSKVEKLRQKEQAAKYRESIADNMPQFSEAVDQLIELIIRDYVAGWMRAITPEVVLQQRIEELLRIVLMHLKSRVMDLDFTELLVTRLVPKVTAHVNDFRKAEKAFRGDSLERSLTESDELDIMVAGKFRNGKLHRALSTSVSTKATEEAYLRNVVQTILPTLLPKNEVQSEILRHLLRELLVGAVLRPIMELLSDPDYWNQNVDLYTGKAIREQNMVKKLREALKQHTDSLDADSRSMENPADPYGPGADLYSFEDFLKMIKRCDSLLDVKRIRNTIMTQMRKKKALVVNREKDDIVNGNKVEDIIVYINRLDIARRRAEKRIEALGGPAYPKRRTRDHTPEVKNGPLLINLETVLTNPAGLSYFMEFQDRRENMNELQFWLLIDSLNIKEVTESKAEIESTRSLSSDEKMLVSSKTNMSTPSSTLSKGRTTKTLDSSTPKSTQATGAAGPTADSIHSLPPGSIRGSRKSSVATFIDVTDTLREDVGMIYDTYFSDSAPRPVDVDHSLIKVFRDFAISDTSSLRSISDTEGKAKDEAKAAHVRRQLLVAQRQVFAQMSAKDYPEFVRSDLYFKFLTTYQNSLAEQKEEESRSHIKPSGAQRKSTGPAILSAIGLTSPSNKRDTPENPKRSSTGSFFDIFGLGRDRDKERDGPLRRAETTIGNLRPGFLTPSSSRSKTSSPSSIRASDTGSNSSLASNLPRSKEATPKKSLDIPSTTAHIPASLGRTRSLSSISNPEIPIRTSSGGEPTSGHRKSSSAMGHGRENSLDLTDTEGLSRSITEDGNPALRDSLLIELQEQEEEDDDAAIEGGLAIPRMPKKKRTNVIDKIEAALSSIMENQGGQTEGLAEGEEKGSGSVPMDLTDPAFSTARDGQAGAAALMEWGNSQEKASKKRFKEKTLESGKTVRVKSREPSEVGRAPLSSMFGAEKAKPTTEAHSEESLSTSQRNSIFSDNDDGDEQKSEGLVRQSMDSVEGYSTTTFEKYRATKSKNVAESISDTATVQDNVHLAAPGDLLLAARIKNLEQDIEMLRKQEAIVETLIQKAEQKGRQDELRILKKSKSALRREILSMEYQKTQYEVQEEENMIMPGRSTINITSSTVGHDGSKEFALYVIEVHQLAQDGSFASGWVIARRYSEFFALHQQLKEKFASIVRQYELPGKRGFLKLQKSFVEGRRIGLERYLQSLVRHEEICQSQELRAFLSQENIALPQFSASTPALPEYNPFDSEHSGQDKSKSGGGSSAPTTPSNQHFFEQLFHSATSPLHSPVATREPSKGLLQSASGAMSGDGSGFHQGTRDADVSQNEGFIKHIYQTVSEDLGDMFSGGPSTVLGDITKKLGNKMMQFSMEDEDERTVVSTAGSVFSPAGSISSRKRHGSHGESGSVRLHIDPAADGLGPLVQQPPQRPPLQRILSARSRRLSSPDPHTQHQKLQIQKQEEQHFQHGRQSSFQEQQHFTQQQQLQQQLHKQQQQPQQSRPAVVEAEGVTMFTEPLCDLFIELFELKEKNNWLRRQAVVIILQQVLGGTIERKLRDTIKTYLEENMLTFYVTKLRDSLWPPAPISPSNTVSGLSGGYEIIGFDEKMAGGGSPGGISSPGIPNGPSAAAKKPVRTAEQKATTKDQANRKLSAFLPELLGNMVGQQNARRGARRVFAAFQNRRLNQQLVYTTLDEVIAARVGS